MWPMKLICLIHYLQQKGLCIGHDVYCLYINFWAYNLIINSFILKKFNYKNYIAEINSG